MAPIPVIGVVEPGATAAVAACPKGSHLVLATEATVRLGAYRRAIEARDSDAKINELPCEVLVSLAEEGWLDGDIARDIVRRYLENLDESSGQPDCVILGCTHFPLLRDAIASVIDDGIVIVDSASTTAAFAVAELESAGLLNEQTGPGSLTLLATDGVTRFARVGGQFLGYDLSPEDIQLVDL
jgi:glutamate racemase